MAGIFAHHAHLFPAHVRPHGSMQRLIQLMDSCAIERAVCFAPFAYQVKDAGLDPNQWLAQELKGQARFNGFGTIDFEAGNLKQQVKRISDFGFKGIKLHPNAQHFDLLAPEALEVYAAAEELNLFLTFHSGVHHARIKEYHVLKFDEVAHSFPRLRFSLEHVGGYSFFKEALAVIVNRIPFPPREGKRCLVFAGLTSVFTLDHNRFWYLGPEKLMELIHQAGAKQCIFGLDFPYNDESHTRAALHMIRSLDISTEARDLILGGNLQRELSAPPAQ